MYGRRGWGWRDTRMISTAWPHGARPAGQHRPTPLLLRYEQGGYNCLHQDLYGDVVFPLQVAILLSRPEEDFTGGENVFVEQRPRAQSRPMVARPEQGQGLVFTVNERSTLPSPTLASASRRVPTPDVSPRRTAAAFVRCARPSIPATGHAGAAGRRCHRSLDGAGAGPGAGRRDVRTPDGLVHVRRGSRTRASTG